jgi:hypothetical protein
MGFSFKKFGKKDSDDAKSSGNTHLHKPSAVKNVRELGKPSKIKPFRATKGHKFALIIGDEGAILIYTIGKTVQSRNFIAHANEEGLKEFESILARDPKAPIYLIVDSMDQSFVQQSLPPISPLGVKKLIKRRLDRDLAADVVKGYVLLERDMGGRRDWNFLMVSLESSPHLHVWYDFIEKVDNRLHGIYLLSVEAENVVKNIDRVINPPKKDKKNKADVPRWKFFVTHNKVGGFRQVILKDGRIIFTRLTQPVGELMTDVIAGNIEQEMSSTVEYMKRLSFSPSQGLEIYIVASADINNAIDLSKIPAVRVHKFTPFEIAGFFGITGAAQPSDQFGDVVMSAFIASSRVHRLVLHLPKAVKINRIYNLMRYQRTFVGLCVLGMLIYGGMLAIGLMQKYTEIENLKQKKDIQQRKLDEINVEVKKSGIDVIKVSDTIALYQQLNDEAQSPLKLLSRIRPAIISAVAIKQIEWKGIDAPDNASQNGAPGSASDSKDEIVTLILRFPEISDTDEAFKSVAKKVLLDVRAVFPEYRVSYTKLPDVLSRKADVGEIKFDNQDKLIEIDKANLEATLTLTKQGTAAPVPVPGAPPMPGLPQISTDDIIGVGK